jgi:hypothetical protein
MIRKAAGRRTYAAAQVLPAASAKDSDRRSQRVGVSDHARDQSIHGHRIARALNRGDVGAANLLKDRRRDQSRGPAWSR